MIFMAFLSSFAFRRPSSAPRFTLRLNQASISGQRAVRLPPSREGELFELLELVEQVECPVVCSLTTDFRILEF